jgi:DNA-binding LacI/PurR family transcriptional regulator
MKQRVSQKEIAQACNVSVATVSYALRNSRHVSESTREQVQKVAKELGYRPDPSLSSLAARKRRSGQATFYASVGVLHPNPKSSRATQLFNIHSHHFKKQMETLGCTVSEFQVDSNRYRPERLAQILRTRCIRGILLGWGQWPEEIRSFPWHEFAVISTERTDLGYAIDKVSMNHFHALDSIFERLDVLSEKRYGLILHDDCPAKTESHILGAYHANLYERTKLDRDVPPYRYQLNEGPERLRAWYQKYKPDVIITHRVIDPRLFEQAGITFPHPTRLVIIEIDEATDIEYSGIYTEATLGQTTAQLLARKMRTYEMKCHTNRAELTLVNGIWHDGVTLGL